jgi:predicted DNA-binding transcriptional regulator YafY
MASPHRHVLASYGIPLPTGATTRRGRRALRVPQIKKEYQRKLARAPYQATTSPIPQDSQGNYVASNSRYHLSVIQAYARSRLMVDLIYKKVTTGETVRRRVEPYSLRIKNGKRYFYAYDTSLPTIGIHSFLVSNIQEVKGTRRPYRPRWVVEF